MMYSKPFLQLSFACYCLLVMVNAQSQEASTETADTTENSPEALDKDVFRWETSTPTATDFDWVRLVSGEWLKGKIKGMYDDSLEFDSDKLDLLTLDWEDVSYVETHIPGSAYIEDHGRVYGYFTIDQNTITVTNGDDAEQYDRSKLVTFITGGEHESDYWSAKITLGLTVAAGNNDQITYNASANIQRKTSFSRFILNYIGNISETQNIQTVNNHRLNATLDRFITRYYFWRPIFGEYYSDPFTNIDYKITIGTGAGYTIIDTKRTNWNVTGGPGYQETRFDSVQPGENIEETTPALVLTTNYDIEFTSEIDLIYSYKITWVNKASGGYTHHMIGTVDSEITGSLDLTVSLMWDYIADPTKNEDGTTPNSTDLQLIVGISYDY